MRRNLSPAYITAAVLVLALATPLVHTAATVVYLGGPRAADNPWPSCTLDGGEYHCQSLSEAVDQAIADTTYVKVHTNRSTINTRDCGRPDLSYGGRTVRVYNDGDPVVFDLNGTCTAFNTGSTNNQYHIERLVFNNASQTIVHSTSNGPLLNVYLEGVGITNSKHYGLPGLIEVYAGTSNVANVTLVDCFFTNNTVIADASNPGYGVVSLVASNSGNVTVTGLIASGNTLFRASGPNPLYGSALYVTCGSFVCTDCHFTGNNVSSAGMIGSTSATRMYGGALYVEAKHTNISYSTFNNNARAGLNVGTAGAVIVADRDNDDGVNTVDLHHFSVSGNQGEVICDNNAAVGMYIEAETVPAVVNMHHFTFADNRVVPVAGVNTSAVCPKYGVAGAAHLALVGSGPRALANVTVGPQGKFLRGFTRGVGAADNPVKSPVVVFGQNFDTVALVDLEFAENIAFDTESGYRLAMDVAAAHVDASYLTIRDNSATTYESASVAYIGGNTTSLTQSVSAGNSISRLSGGSGTDGQSGRGVMLTSAFGNEIARVTVADCVFSNNSASNFGVDGNGNGVGMRIQSAQSADIQRCNYTNNHISADATAFGGGLSFDYNDGLGATSVSIDECLFDSNRIDVGGMGGGGALAFTNQYDLGRATISNCVFTNNSVTVTSQDNWIGGGAVFALLVHVDMSGCAVHSNSAGVGGGVSVVGGNLTLTTTSLIANSAAYVGGAVLTLANTSANANRVPIPLSGEAAFTLDDTVVVTDNKCALGTAFYVAGNSFSYTGDMSVGASIATSQDAPDDDNFVAVNYLTEDVFPTSVEGFAAVVCECTVTPTDPKMCGALHYCPPGEVVTVAMDNTTYTVLAEPVELNTTTDRAILPHHAAVGVEYAILVETPKASLLSNIVYDGDEESSFIGYYGSKFAAFTGVADGSIVLRYHYPQLNATTKEFPVVYADAIVGSFNNKLDGCSDLLVVYTNFSPGNITQLNVANATGVVYTLSPEQYDFDDSLDAIWELFVNVTSCPVGGVSRLSPGEYNVEVYVSNRPAAAVGATWFTYSVDDGSGAVSTSSSSGGPSTSPTSGSSSSVGGTNPGGTGTTNSSTGSTSSPSSPTTSTAAPPTTEPTEESSSSSSTVSQPGGELGTETAEADAPSATRKILIASGASMGALTVALCVVGLGLMVRGRSKVDAEDVIAALNGTDLEVVAKEGGGEGGRKVSDDEESGILF